MATMEPEEGGDASFALKPQVDTDPSGSSAGLCAAKLLTSIRQLLNRSHSILLVDLCPGSHYTSRRSEAELR
jgi:hypothetical protein